MSWCRNAIGYHALFNRDEQRTRRRASGPSVHRYRQTAYLAPTDPEGGGTWILTNARGVTLALLNRYEGSEPAGPLTSRGQLLVAAADLPALTDLRAALLAQPLERFRPFTLAGLDGDRVLLAGWDGRELTWTDSRESGLVHTSSKVDPEAVTAARRGQFHGVTPSLVTLRELHASHRPARGSVSVCMHRDDARTVSFCEVAVGPDVVAMRYTDGPPCDTRPDDPVTLTRGGAPAAG